MSENQGNKEKMPKESEAAEKPLGLMRASVDCADHSMLDEVSIIDNMTSFLKENGGKNVDQSVLRNMAEALSKNINDTSPGTLQDVTMDNTYGVGYRSPCVSMQQYHGASSSSGVQGRSVREFEEHTAALRKENFNLKLRLYFIEENIPALKCNGGDGSESSAMRELIDQKVEVEMLRREIEEKKNVLLDALRAIEDLENIQKETVASYETKLDELRQKIQFLEMDRQVDKSENNEFMSNNMLGHSELVASQLNAQQKISELEMAVKKGEDNVNELENKVSFLDAILSKRDETIKEYEDKIKKLEYQNAELQENLDERMKELASSELCKKELGVINDGLRSDLKMASFVPEQNIKEYLEKCLQDARNQNESINHLQKIREDLRNHRIELANKVCTIEELEERLANAQKKSEQAVRSIQALTQTVKMQQNELNRLKSEDAAHNNSSNLLVGALNKKHTTSSSSGFNTEGTAINRSLSDTEALRASCTDTEKRDLETTIELQENMIKSLQAEVKKKTADLQNLVNKELWGKNREIERLTKLISNCNANSPISPQSACDNTSHELQQSYTEAEYAKALERNKLLQRKVDILIQRLSVERENESVVANLRKEVREARADAERSEQFRRDCANLCTILTERLEELAGFLNTLLKHKNVLGFLAADRRHAMRKAVDRSLDLSKSLNRTLSFSGVSLTDQNLSQLCNLSEILGVLDISVTEDNPQNDVAEMKTFNSHEEQNAIETLKAENKALKKELDKRRIMEATKKERRSMPAATLASLENQSESEAWSEPDRKVSLARIGLEDHSITKDLSATQGSRLDTDSESEASGDNLNQSPASKIHAQQQELVARFDKLIARRDERILQIQCQLVEADNRLKKETLRVRDLTEEVETLRQRNEQLNADLVSIGGVDNSSSAITRDESMWLRQIEEQSQLLECIQNERDRLSKELMGAENQIAELKKSMEKMHSHHQLLLQKANDEERQHLEELRKKMETTMEMQLQEQQQIHTETLQQLTELQRQYVEAQRSIDSHIENAKELRQTLVESELNARALKKQLDESALQASKAVMERTKAMNEKLQLEQTLEEYKSQITIMQSERETLQKRLEEIEELQRKKAMQSPKNTALNGSDVSQSGYTSEEVAPLTRNAGNGGVTASASVQQDATNCSRNRINNSSPDLGIESDAGRVSSVELTNAHRSLLMKIEMPKDNVQREAGGDGEKKIKNETDNLDTENRPPNGSLHDCAKVEQELAELRRKLIRTKRALEDTYQQLRNSNQMKAQIEKDIKNQIIKTHNVLKNVRSNMEIEK